ncbi:MAG TPA: flagellin, partial [Mobilitalea sp.]|nr:flagellin [Mobilitalea sp.]
TQISGLDQASRNASDGISVIQTAEGALQEVESMLQRSRELSVQSANGTYTAKDRTAIQSEIDQLSQEITRISNTTQFNTMTLLDGNIDRKSYSSNNSVSLVSLSDSVPVGNYGITITQDARQAVIVGNQMADTTTTRKILAGEAGSININGESVQVNEGDTLDDVFQKIRDACDTVNVSAFVAASGVPPVTNANQDLAGYTSMPLGDSATQSLVFVTRDYGSNQKLDIYCDNQGLGDLLGLTIKGASAAGVDAQATLDYTQFGSTATVSVSGNKVTVSDRNDFNMVFDIDPGTEGTQFTDTTITASDKPSTPAGTPIPKTTGIPITVSVLDAGPMDLQIGANEGQTMSIRIPKVTPETLGIDRINIGTAEGAQQAVGLLDNAVNQVSAIRSKLGAYQNRLEHSISNLDTTSENMTESLSRISDVDMASEMANYTQKNVLAQAGTSMLAQANQRPQMILSLLQQQ